MSKFDVLQHRAMALAGQVGDGLRHAMPGHAGKWLHTGATLGAARMAAHTASRSVRRHPAISGSVVLAVVAGAGLLWWASKRRKQQEMRGGRAIEGSSTRVEGRQDRKGGGRQQRSRNGGSSGSNN
ncbi:hypothetical protein E4582_10565 [Luteimonas yindakuii]|uniref:Uncharacterized protein n=1 Tax=Luteimonas yindakuii TaxID=2565782 RepID=A0A4Z1R6T5_9GAMM|nr:hypothetical protein [Luteimonas yindakuii]TKS55160.1 hypothetical protein E4582_10565 [Luteimonas yindakuii]